MYVNPSNVSKHWNSIVIIAICGCILFSVLKVQAILWHLHRVLELASNEMEVGNRFSSELDLSKRPRYDGALYIGRRRFVCSKQVTKLNTHCYEKTRSICAVWRLQLGSIVDGRTESRRRQCPRPDGWSLSIFHLERRASQQPRRCGQRSMEIENSIAVADVGPDPTTKSAWSRPGRRSSDRRLYPDHACLMAASPADKCCRRGRRSPAVEDWAAPGRNGGT